VTALAKPDPAPAAAAPPGRAAVPTKPRPDLLPVSYVEAKKKLAACERVDECQSWADKAAALRSYGKQMKDQSLVVLAQKIQARAVQRGGELLLQVKADRVAKKDKGSKGGRAPSNLSRKTAASDAGLSPHQAKTMVRVAKVPEEQFEQLVEAGRPATVEQLAELGTNKRPKVKPAPYRNEWLDWTNAVHRLSALPACGLDVLASREPDQIEQLRQDCADALVNLGLWHRTLEKANG
jgi:hypothetical protein